MSASFAKLSGRLRATFGAPRAALAVPIGLAAAAMLLLGGIEALPTDAIVPSANLLWSFAGAALAASAGWWLGRSRSRRQLADGVREVIVAVDATGHIVACNRAVETVFGHPAKTLRGQPVAALLPAAGGDGGWSRLLADLGDGSGCAPEIRNREVSGRRRDGSDVVLAATVGDDVVGGQRVITLLLRDVRDELASRQEIELIASHWRHAHEVLQSANEEIERASRAKSTFLANMSHEIRTPMTAILGFADRLMAERLDEHERRDAIETIRRSGYHLLEILDDILDLSKIESGKLRIESVPCSPRRLVGDAAELLRVRARDKGLTLDVQVADDVPECVRTDPTRLRQILFNLLGNAIKFTSTGSVTVKLTVDPRAPTTGDELGLVLSVRDTGIGLTAEQQGRLFQAFEQADSSTTRRFGGTGLGLAICRRLARMLGGDIAVVSEFGRGSTFTVHFVARSADADAARSAGGATESLRTQAAAATANAPGAPAAPLHGRILLAEDGLDNQRLIAAILRRQGAEVLVADNGLVAVELTLQAAASGDPFAMVLMDVQMPVMDGLEAVRTLRRAGYTGPILALTANVLASDREQCLIAGCDDFHGKPIDRVRLLEQIHAQLHRHSAIG